MSTLRFLMLLSLIVWIGGIVFLSFVEAPTAFSVAPTRHMAGTLVGHSLTILHWMGLFAGVIFLGSSMLLSSLTADSAQPLAARHILVCAMLLLTLVSQFGISQKLATLRAQFGDIDAVAPDNPARIQFDALHRWSVRLEVVVLLMGLAVTYLTAQL
jgi:hypothetical protein